MAEDEDMAAIEAIKAYPFLDDKQSGWSTETAAEQLNRQGRHRRMLSEKYQSEARLCVSVPSSKGR